MRIFLLLLLCFPFTILAANKGMVVSESKIASQVGADILQVGGNAIDAAVAVGYALAVVQPCCGNIGGGGFMTLRLANGKEIFINFREKAPLKASRDMFANRESTEGYLAVATPGTVLGFETALEKYGTMTREQVMLPAINLAKNGYLVTATDKKLFKQFISDFRKQSNVAAIFLKDGKAYAVNDRLKQPDLANTLTQIANQGSTIFYRGSLAKEIVAASQTNGGILTLTDFAQYNVKESKPLQCTYRGYTIATAALPSSGGVALCEMLNILENFPLAQLGYQSPTSIRIIVEAMRYAFADRNTKLGDPDFVESPVEVLTSKTYAKKISEQIRQSTFAPKTVVPLIKELTDTTHYSVIDDKGNAASVTYTINGFFGARVIPEKTGFFLNNEMDDFTTHPGRPNKFGLVQQDKNAIEPGKRPLSSMAPTIVTKDGKIVMVLGSPGGPRIITAILLTLLNVIDYDMPLQEAINTPRFHFQGEPNTIFVEPFTFSFLTTKKLNYFGYQTTTQSTWAAVSAIFVKPDGTVVGTNDYRRPDGGVATF